RAVVQEARLHVQLQPPRVGRPGAGSSLRDRAIRRLLVRQLRVRAAGRRRQRSQGRTADVHDPDRVRRLEVGDAAPRLRRTPGETFDAIVNKKTTVWATNPTQSNSGATALFAFLDYLAGNKPGTQLPLGQLSEPRVKEGITRFLRVVSRTPPSTGTMMDDCI